MSKYNYLDEERKKLWDAVEDIRNKIKEYTPEEISALTAQVNQIAESLATSQATESRYQEIVSQAESAIEEINASLVTVKEKRETLEGEATAAQTSIQGIEQIVQDASLVSDQANKVKADLESTEAEIIEKRAVLSEVADIHIGIEDLRQKVELLHKNILEREKATSELHKGIFGYIDTNSKGEEEKVEGLKDQLESTFKELSAGLENANEELNSIQEASETKAEALEISWNAKHQGLNDKIEKLLPHALTAGLSAAYADKKSEEITDQKRLRITFNIAIIGLLLVSLIPFGVSAIYIVEAQLTMEDVLNRMPKLVLAIIPLYAPILWVAYSASKKLNLSKRLFEEYSHKEVVSRTFEGLSREIERIQDEDITTDLRVKLLYNVLKISSENPGKLITDYNRSDHPIIEVLDHSSKLTDAVDKLNGIPGFGKLSDMLAKQASKSTKEQASKVFRGLDLNDPQDSDDVETV